MFSDWIRTRDGVLDHELAPGVVDRPGYRNGSLDQQVGELDLALAPIGNAGDTM